MILVQVQKEAALLVQIVPSQRVTCSLTILFLAPHLRGPAILRGTEMIQETRLRVSQDMIHSAHMIMPHHPVERPTLGLTP